MTREQELISRMYDVVNDIVGEYDDISCFYGDDCDDGKKEGLLFARDKIMEALASHEFRGKIFNQE